MPAPQEFDELLIACLARIDAEGERGLEAFCREHPERAERLRASVALLRDPDASGSSDRFMGEFELLGRLGQGGMGTVYLARRSGERRPLALKLVRPERMYFPGARQRFLREVESVARFAHPGVVAIHAVGEAEGIPYVAMEYVRGVALRDLLDELGERNPAILTGNDLFRALVELHDAPSDADAAQRPPYDDSWPAACLWIVRELAQALEYAHQRGVLHRNVRPENVMLTAEGRVVLLDFGLDVPQESGGSRGPGLASEPGTGADVYRPPEQLEGRMHQISARTDVYALGALLFELLSFERLLPGEAGDELRRLVPSLSQDYAVVVGKATALDPAQRYRSAADLALDLTRLMEHRPVQARVPGPWAQLAGWAREHRAAAALLSLGWVLAIGGSLAFGLDRWRAKNAVMAGARAAEQGQAGALLERDSLRAQLEAARGERAQLEAAHAAAERARDAAELERARAEGNLDRALEAVEQLLAEVATLRWSDTPELARTRSRLLGQTRDLYTELETSRGGDRSIRWRASQVGLALAEHELERGRVDAAEAELRAQVSILRDLVDRDSGAPVEPEHRGGLALALARLASIELLRDEPQAALALTDEARRWLEQGMILDVVGDRAWVATWSVRRRAHRALGEREPALREVERAITAARRYLDRHPDSAEARRLLAEELLERARMSLEAGTAADLGLAAGYLERARAPLEALVEADRRDPLARERLLEVNGVLADTQRRLDRPDEALATLERAVDLALDLVRDEPLDAERLERLQALRLELAEVAAEQGKRARARLALERAGDGLSELVALAPERVAFRHRLGDALAELGRLDLEEGRGAAAVETLTRAVEAHRAALSIEPAGQASEEGERRRRQLARAQLLVARAATATGDWALVAEQLDLARPTLVGDPQEAPALARAWMEAAERVGQAGGGGPSDELAVGQPQADRDPSEADLGPAVWVERLHSGALRTLEEAARRGTLDRDDLAANPLWEPLKNELRFRALLD